MSFLQVACLHWDPNYAQDNLSEEHLAVLRWVHWVNAPSPQKGFSPT